MINHFDTLAKRVSYITQTKELSDSALARIAGVTGPAITSIREGETLNPKLSVVQNICRNFRLNYDWFIDGEGPIYRDENPAYMSSVQNSWDATVHEPIPVYEDGEKNPYVNSVVNAIGDLLTHFDSRLQKIEQDGR